MAAVSVSVRDARSAPADRLWIQSVYRDYLDDRRFPTEESGGVLVIQAPDERQLMGLIARIDRLLFGDGDDTRTPQPLLRSARLPRSRYRDRK